MSIDNLANEAFEVVSNTGRPPETLHDKDLVVFVCVRNADGDRLQRAGRAMTKVHQDINESETTIDQLGFYTSQLGDEQLFMFNPSSPRLDEMTGGQAELGQESTQGFLPDRLAVVVDALNKHLPEWLTPKIGPWWLGAFGQSPPVICRLVMPGGGKIARSENVNGNVLKKFIQEYRNESYLLQAIIRHRPGDLPPHYEYSVTVRIALFAPRHQITSRADLAEVLGGNRPRNPTTVFEPLGVSSNWNEFDGPLSQSSWNPDSVHVSRSSSIERLQDVFGYVTGTEEWSDFQGERYVGASAYDHVCDYTELMAREADLRQFFTLASPSDSHNPWADAYGRNPDQATVMQELSRSGKQTAMELSDESSEPPAEIADKQRSSANDGNEDHWEDIKKTARIFREQGYDFLIIDQDSGSRPDLWVRSPDGQIYAVEVECTSPSNPENALSNISRTALWGYPVIIVASDEGVADTIRDLAAKPFKATDGGHTHFYNASRISVDDHPVVVPADAGDVEWWGTPEHTRKLKIGGTVLAETALDAPFDDYKYPLPRLHRDGSQYIIKDDEERKARYQTKERFQANWQFLSSAHIPVGLSYFQFIESMHVLEDNRLVEYHPTADWDTPRNAERHEASHEDAFTSFLIDKDGSELDEPPVREFIRNWIGAQTQYGPPADNIYGEYRQDYTNRSRDDNRPTANRFYTDKAYRFPRGLVHPDAKGLNTIPEFPEDWDVPDDERRREPLIHELSTQTTTYDPDDT